MRDQCPNSGHMLPITRKMSEPLAGGVRNSRCPACEGDVRIVFLLNHPQAWDGYYYPPHLIEG
jgi:hypothetical protein